MVFADLFFLFIFFPLCLLCYYMAKSIRTKNIVLIIFSLLFYAWGEKLWFLLPLSALFNWAIGLWIEKTRESAQGKLAVAVGLIGDIGLLLVFKYTDFFISNFNGIFGTNVPLPGVHLPIGISFFTFQAISYVLDCYWETVEVQKKFPKFLLYLSLFPQLIAGPIVRYSVVEKEIDQRSVSASDIAEGIQRVIIGLAKKAIVANSLYAIVSEMLGEEGQFIASQSFLGTWFGIILYALYVYYDFSAYSDMAIGMGRMFGFHFDENFDHPFVCTTIAEFWQRWHISLGSFFRDYLLYVKIFGKNRIYLSLFLVWFCTGMWHGAAWNFILWGLFYGCFMFFEQKMGRKRMKKWPTLVKHIYTKVVITIGFGIFMFVNMKDLGIFFRNISGVSMILGKTGFADRQGWSFFVRNLFLIVAAIACSLPLLPKLKKTFLESRNDTVYTVGRIAAVVGCLALLIVSVIFLIDNTNNPFLYFRF